MKIVTDTATLVLYDLSQLKHRMDDGYDWWSDPTEEIGELNRGNVLFVGLNEDGAYEVNIINGANEDLVVTDHEAESECIVVQATLKNSSGRFFIGPGEAVTSEGEEPEESIAGHFFNVKPGSYQVRISSEGKKIEIRLKTVDDFVENNFDESPVLYEADENSYLEFTYYEDTSEIIDSIVSHLEELDYEWEESDEADGEEDGLVYFHEEYGYLMLESYEGGVRLFTAVEYDAVEELDQDLLVEWRTKLYMVLDYFNSSSTVAKAYDDPDANQIIIDVWYPAVYTEKAFEVFIGHWHDDITLHLENAENDIFGDHVLH